MTTGTTSASVEPDLVRFDRTERVVHWITASLFLVLMLTGAALYAGPLSTVIGRRVFVRDLHVIAGVALPLPLLFGLVGRWGAALRNDLGRLNRWSRDDRVWMRQRTRHRARLGKFNPGQKLNATFLGAAIVLMLGSGAIMKWFDPFPLGWRTGATFVHDWTALGIWLAIGGHILFALRDPDALGAMRHGTISARWARRERPRWFEEDAAPDHPMRP
ncbi:MAG TPA: cytochrome b/b6 domain-containing protein [Acidimicrobiia bacterium]|nr:cytochrome b/b6 domain-containing protein [Acidimicrobiia bacterium]